MNRSVPNLLTAFVASSLLAWTLTLASAPIASAAEDIVAQTVAAPFDKVVTRLKRAVTAQKLVIIKEVPYQKMLAMVGVKADKMLGFEIFHPRYGKVLYAQDPNAFLEVPLRILVSESGGKVTLTYRKPSVVFAPYPGLDDLGKELDEVFAAIVASVAK